MTKGTSKGVHTGLCSGINLFTLTSYSLPVTVVMLNSFIHLSVSHHCFTNHKLCGQFYQVFAHAAEVGEMIRLFLLKNRTVGRMLDLFYNGYGGIK
jgi:hypothetical protein